MESQYKESACHRLTAARKELLKLFKPGDISNYSDTQSSQRFEDEEQRKKRDEAQTQQVRVGNNLLFWQESLQVVEPEIRGSSAYCEGTGWT